MTHRNDVRWGLAGSGEKIRICRGSTIAFRLKMCISNLKMDIPRLKMYISNLEMKLKAGVIAPSSLSLMLFG